MQKFSYQNTIDVYNKISKEYLKEISKQIPDNINTLIKLLPKGAKVLDVGCAGGRDTDFFIQHGFSATGIDASSAFIAYAKKNVPKGVFKEMNVIGLKFPKNSFDLLWARSVLLHLKRTDIPKVLKKFYAILKPNGYLYISVKKGTGEAYVAEKRSLGNERFYTYFSKQEMVDLLKKNNFKIISTEIHPDDTRKGVTWIRIIAQK